MEDDQGPAESHPPAAVCSSNLDQVVHTSCVAVIVQDDGKLPVLTITDLSYFSNVYRRTMLWLLVGR